MAMKRIYSAVAAVVLFVVSATMLAQTGRQAAGGWQ